MRYIGLTGPICAGKGTIAAFLESQGYPRFSTSDELRAVAKEKSLQVDSREVLQKLAKELREVDPGFLAKQCVDRIKKEGVQKATIDGIRHPQEVEALQELEGFVLFSIDAPVEERFRRNVERDREGAPKQFLDFVQEDKREQGINESGAGQRIAECMKLAGVAISNAGTIKELKRSVLGKIDSRPSWEEYFVGISRAVAKRATCDRGRSGCVIARDKQILVTGYVGSPRGLPHCDQVGHQMKTVKHEDGSESSHCVRTTHAEQNAICQAAKQGISIGGATLYCKMTPCSICAKMIINAGIQEVICEKAYHRGAESEEMFEAAGVTLKILDASVEKYENQ